MVSWPIGELDQQEWISRHGVFAQTVDPSDVGASRVNVFQNGCQLLVVVVFKVEFRAEGTREGQKNAQNGQASCLGHLEERNERGGHNGVLLPFLTPSQIQQFLPVVDTAYAQTCWDTATISPLCVLFRADSCAVGAYRSTAH